MKPRHSFRRVTVIALVVLIVTALVCSTKKCGKYLSVGKNSTKDAATAPKAERPLALLHFIGRFDTHDAAGPRFAWPGTAIAATFEGSGIDAKLRDAGTNFFSVVIDGGAATALSTNQTQENYTLAAGLAPGRHTLLLTKRTESSVGTVQLLGLFPRDGALAASPPPYARRIELVGDSITCGYGNLGKTATCPFSPDTEDETSAYGGLAGQELAAEVWAIAYSGIGMYRNYEGSTDNQMPALFERTIASERATWPFAAPEPDVVVVHLGTNDFARGNPGEPFARAYVAFLRQLRGHYPHARVICALSPMLYDLADGAPNGMARTNARAAIQEAVRARTAAGDTRVSYFAFAPPRPEEGFGCDFHPSAATHRVMATALVDEIRRLTGW